MKKSNVVSFLTVAAISIGMLLGGGTIARAVGNDSDQALHFWLDGVTPTYATGSASLAWSASLVGSNSTTDVSAGVTCPANATEAYIFATKRGTERNGMNAYFAYNVAFMNASKQVIQPQLKLPSLTSGPLVGIALRYSADPLSLGIACTTNDGLTVVAAAYRYITINNLATGAWTADAAVGGTTSASPTASATPTATSSASPTTTPSATASATASPTPTETLAPLVESAIPSWAKSATFYYVNVRNFSALGTLKGFRDQVPRLKRLGVKVIVFSPLTPISAGDSHLGTLGSPYAVDDYQAINPEFGTSSEFKVLVDYLHGNGMKVIAGWNAMSTGLEHSWITEHPTWYLKSNGALVNPLGSGETDKAVLDYTNGEMRLAMISAMKYWLTTYGVDGFSCAYASQVPADFWSRAAAQLAVTKSSLLWLSDSDSRTDLRVNSFSSGLGDSLFNRFINLKAKSLSVSAFSAQVSSISAPANDSWMPVNYTSNEIVNSQYGSNVKVFGTFANAFSILSFTLPGNVMIFNGQEIAANKKFSLVDKANLVWPRTSATSDFFTKLIALRSKNKSLWTGSEQRQVTLLDSGSANVLAFSRDSGTNKVIVLVNLGTARVKNALVKFAKAPGNVYNFTTGRTANLGTSLKYTLDSGSFAIYSSEAAR